MCGRSGSLRAKRVSIDRLADLRRRCAGTPVLAAHADQHDERLAAEARLAVRRCQRRCRLDGERGRPEPGGSHCHARRALHLHDATDDRRARSGDGNGNLEIRSREGRRAESRRVVLARRRPAASANPGGNNGRTSARARRRNRKTCADLRRSRRHRPARRRRRQVPENAVHDGVSGDHLPQSDHHRRTRAGRQSRRPRDGCSRVGCAHRQAGLDVPYDPASRRARIRDMAEGLLDDGGLARELGLRFGRRRTRAPVPANRPACVAVLRRPSRAEESVLLVGGRTRGQHRQSPLELSADAPRPVGLRQLGNARAGRCHAERPAHSRRRHRREVGPDVLSRANHGQADLSRRRTARAAERYSRRSDMADAAVSGEAAAAVSAQHQARRGLHR